jgi:TonB family protein
MSGRRYLIRAYALAFVVHVHLALAQSGAAATPSDAGAPPADSIATARLAWGSDPAKRCPELRNAAAEEGAAAVVLFRVGTTGVASRASIRESSGSQSFDAAAVGCVLKLRFQSATRLGDAVAVESWQQYALKAPAPARAAPTAHCEPSATVVADAPESSDAHRAQPGPETARAGVCVCVDESGKIAQAPVLTSSSGNTGFDKAALEVSAAAHYRPAISASGQPAPGCFRFKVALEVK